MTSDTYQDVRIVKNSTIIIHQRHFLSLSLSQSSLSYHNDQSPKEWMDFSFFVFGQKHFITTSSTLFEFGVCNKCSNRLYFSIVIHSNIQCCCMEYIFIEGVVVVCMHQMENWTKPFWLCGKKKMVQRNREREREKNDHDWMDRLIQQSLRDSWEEDLSTAFVVGAFFICFFFLGRFTLYLNVWVNSNHDDDDDTNHSTIGN